MFAMAKVRLRPMEPNVTSSSKAAQPDRIHTLRRSASSEAPPVASEIGRVSVYKLLNRGRLSERRYRHETPPDPDL